MELFLLFCLFGIIAGLVYLLFCFVRGLFNFNLFVSVPLDLLTGLIIGFLFFYATSIYALGEVRLYLCIGFILGIFLVCVTMKNFVASASNFVYNRIRKLIIRLKEKLFKRRKANG